MGGPWVRVGETCRGQSCDTRWLSSPDVTSIAGKLTALKSSGDGVLVADLATGSVDNVGTSLHACDHLIVEHVLSFGVEGAVDGDNVANLDHVLGGLVPCEVQLFLNLLNESMVYNLKLV